jgi:hypothetical protein
MSPVTPSRMLGRPEEEALFKGRLAAVERDSRAFFFAEVDVGADPVPVGVPDQGRKLRVLLVAWPDLHVLRGLLDRLDDPVRSLPEGHEDASGQGTARPRSRVGALMETASRDVIALGRLGWSR